MLTHRPRVHAAACLAVFCAGIGAAVAGASHPAALTLAGPEVLRLVQNEPAALSSYPAVRMTGKITYSLNGRAFDGELSGVMTPDQQVGTEMVSVPSAGKRFTVTTINHKIFLRLPSGNLPGGAHFAGCTLPPQSGGADIGNIGPDPLAYLRLMPGATGAVKVLGHHSISGVSTTEYEVEIDVVKATQRLQQEGRETKSVSVQQLRSLGVTTMPYDVWIDDQKAIRQFAYHLPAAHGFGMKAEFRLSGATSAPPVTEPPASDVYYVSDCNSLGQFASFG